MWRQQKQSTIDGQTDDGQSDPYVVLCFAGTTKIVAAFRRMQEPPAKHSYAWLPRKCDNRTDTRTDEQIDAGQSDPYLPLCFTSDTKTLDSSRGICGSFNSKVWLPESVTTDKRTDDRLNWHKVLCYVQLLWKCTIIFQCIFNNNTNHPF